MRDCFLKNKPFAALRDASLSQNYTGKLCNGYGTLNIKNKWGKKKKETLPLFTALRQTHCLAHAFSLCTSQLLPSTVAKETKSVILTSSSQSDAGS